MPGGNKNCLYKNSWQFDKLLYNFVMHKKDKVSFAEWTDRILGATQTDKYPVYLEPSQTSIMELFVKIIKG